MKIHIHCPGPMTDGLDSPTRGEGRWAQNLARVLANAGHQVFATGGGIPSWGNTVPVDNVWLVSESVPKRALDGHGPFDLSIDPCWWKDKPPMVTAKRYLVLKWSLEDYTRVVPLPKNQFLCYPLNIHTPQFFKDDCVNKGRTFFLPLPFGSEMCEPNFNKKGLLWTCKDIDRVQSMRENAFMVAEKVLYPLLDKEEDLYVVWLMLDMLRRFGFDAKVRDKDIAVNNLVPYCELRKLLSECKLVVAINIPGSVHDAAVLGVPTLEWEDGGFFNSVGRKYDVLLERGAGPERISEVVGRYLYDREFYTNYVRDIQHELRFNTDGASLQHFNTIVESIF